MDSMRGLRPAHSDHMDGMENISVYGHSSHTGQIFISAKEDKNGNV